MTEAKRYPWLKIVWRGVAALLAGLGVTPSPASGEGPLQVHWYHDIGTVHTTRDIDWSTPDRTTSASVVNWQSTSAPWEPDAPTDQYGVRVVGTFQIETAGEYGFRLGSDDGSRLHLNDDLLIDNDGRHSMSYVEAMIELEPGAHPFEIFYYENRSDAGLHLEWRPPGEIGWVTMPAAAFGGTSPIEVEWYETDHPISRFEDVDWSAPTRHTRESQINWPNRRGSGFLPGQQEDRFALRARTRLIVPEDGMYRFELGSDDGSRLSIGGETIVDRNQLQSFRWETREVFLTEGVKDLEILFFENTGYAGLVLMWQRPSDSSPTVIPSEAFLSPAGTAKPRITRWTEQPRLRTEREPLD